MNSLNDWVSLLRIKQWIKNSLIVVGFVFARQFSLIHLCSLAFVFFSFCFMASAVYLFNDVVDEAQDRLHPRKRHRPIASGRVSKKQAVSLCIVLVALSVILAVQISYHALLIVLLYFFLNIFYSFNLKHVVILDVFVIASGFLLRLLMGTFALGFPVSRWFLLCALMLTLFLGFAKRRSELMQFSTAKEHQTRKVLSHYSKEMLDVFIAITASCAILSYGLFTVLATDSFSQHLFFNIPVVVYGLFRYIYLVYHHQKGQDTSSDFFEDWHLILAGFIWVLSVIVFNFIY